jgi:glutathione-independent formaldehyde dehydrogenase
MKAVVHRGPYKVAVEDVRDPRIEAPGDAIIKITTTNICGSDLHMYEGRTAVEEGEILGHENMGIVAETGPGVTWFEPGDRVSVPFNIACGTCRNCVAGWSSFCLRTNRPREWTAPRTATPRWDRTTAGRPSTCACRSRTTTC